MSLEGTQEISSTHFFKNYLTNTPTILDVGDRAVKKETKSLNFMELIKYIHKIYNIYSQVMRK